VAKKVIGTVKRVVGPVVEIAGAREAQMLELVEVGDQHLVGEVVRVRGEVATAQVYEDTTGLTPGEEVHGTGLPLSVELGPGIMGSIFDGVQRPLTVIRDKSDQYIRRGIQVPVLDREKEWVFTPTAKVGEELRGGMVLGTVPETAMIEHKVLVPAGAPPAPVQGEGAGVGAAGDRAARD
jgi:V/A-type H+-transporting ATPase subunit A